MTNFDEWWYGYKQRIRVERKSVISLMEDAFIGGFDYATSFHEERQQNAKEGEQQSTNKQSTPCCDVCGFPLNENMECISRIAHINE